MAEGINMESWMLSVYYGKRTEPGTVKPHAHDFWQLEIVIRGVIPAVLNGDNYSLETGDLLLIPPGWEHGFVYEKPGIAWITLKFERREDGAPPWGGYIRGSHFTDRLVSSFKTAIRGAVLKEYEKVFVAGFIETVFQYVRSDDFNKPEDSSNMLLQRITDKILARNGRAVTVNELAEELSYSRSHLSKKFKEMTGENLKAYIDKLRMEKIEEMLRYREFGISDLAAELGFSDIFSFSRFFKKHAGVSPREFK